MKYTVHLSAPGMSAFIEVDADSDEEAKAKALKASKSGEVGFEYGEFDLSNPDVDFLVQE